MRLFTYDQLTNELQLNTPELFLIPEFKLLLERDHTEGKMQCYKEFAYIYLMCDWASPYSEYSDEDRLQEALHDSGIDAKQREEDKDFQNACKKYLDMQNQNLGIQMITSARRAIHRVIDYFNDEVDFSERTEAGIPVYKPKTVMDEIGSLGPVYDELTALEKRVKEGLKAPSTIKGGLEDGFMPGEI